MYLTSPHYENIWKISMGSFYLNSVELWIYLHFFLAFDFSLWKKKNNNKSFKLQHLARNSTPTNIKSPHTKLTFNCTSITPQKVSTNPSQRKGKHIFHRITFANSPQFHKYVISFISWKAFCAERKWNEIVGQKK